MKEVIDTITKDLQEIYPSFHTILLRVFYSKGHLMIETFVDGQKVAYDLGVAQTLKISDHVNKLDDTSNNRLDITITEDKVATQFYFDDPYFISSQQGLLYQVAGKNRAQQDLSPEEIEDFLIVGAYAIGKADLNNLITKACKLYLEIHSCQLVTDIPPNVIKTNDGYLLLCDVTNADLQQANLKNVLTEKIKVQYQL